MLTQALQKKKEKKKKKKKKTRKQISLTSTENCKSLLVLRMDLNSTYK